MKPGWLTNDHDESVRRLHSLVTALNGYNSMQNNVRGGRNFENDGTATRVSVVCRIKLT